MKSISVTILELLGTFRLRVYAYVNVNAYAWALFFLVVT